jgi:predicted LPLAT superfamily acyltransferase
MSLAWKIKEERGSKILIRIMQGIIFHLGRRASRVVLYFIIAYYFITAKAKKKISRQFLQKTLKRPVKMQDI